MLAAVILLIATNAGLIGVSRLTYSMGQHRQLPEGAAPGPPQVPHPLHRDPDLRRDRDRHPAPGPDRLPGDDVLVRGDALVHDRPRRGDPAAAQRSADAERTWKPPLNFRAFGFEVPLTAVLGGLGTFAAWIVVMALNPRTLVVGIGWMALGIAVYVLYRRNQKLPLTETVKVVLPEPLGVEEVEYRSVLVAFEDDEPFSPEMVATAVKLASKRRRGIHVHSMMTVPTNLPLDAELPEPGSGGAEQDRAGEADRRPAGDRPRRPGAARPGRLLDRRGGEADQGGGDRRRPALPQRRAALRQDPADGARRAPLPGDRRLRPDRQAARRSPAPPWSRPTDEQRARLPRRVRTFSPAFVAIGLLLLSSPSPTAAARLSLGFLMGLAFLASASPGSC